MTLLAEFLTELSALHSRAKDSALTREERIRYEDQREELAQALLNAQKLTLQPGTIARRSLRVAQALRTELTFEHGVEKTVTLDVSSCGFSVLTGSAPQTPAPFPFSIFFSSREVVSGTAVIVNINPQPSHIRLGCEIRTIADEDRERLQGLVFDIVLRQLLNAGAGTRK